jgi:hypothetical protein
MLEKEFIFNNKLYQNYVEMRYMTVNTSEKDRNDKARYQEVSLFLVK